MSLTRIHVAPVGVASATNLTSIASSGARTVIPLVGLGGKDIEVNAIGAAETWTFFETSVSNWGFRCQKNASYMVTFTWPTMGTLVVDKTFEINMNLSGTPKDNLSTDTRFSVYRMAPAGGRTHSLDVILTWAGTFALNDEVNFFLAASSGGETYLAREMTLVAMEINA